jgi:LmbE family N-acetylglucosaminyl deacetylase
MSRKTILGVFAHPDDESMGPGATFAKYAAAGQRVAFVTATDGGAGRLFDKRPTDNTELRRIRRAETARAAEILGIEFLGFLGWHDGDLKNLNVLDIEIEIAKIIRREKPDVLITFHGSGISYHPDHRVLALALNGAFMGSARRLWYREGDVDSLPPHQPSKLYHYTIMKSALEGLDWPREVYASPDAEVTTRIDTKAWADTRWEAIRAHESQRDGPPFAIAYQARMFESEGFVRVFPSWRPGEPLETDLLAGL